MTSLGFGWSDATFHTLSLLSTGTPMQEGAQGSERSKNINSLLDLGAGRSAPGVLLMERQASAVACPVACSDEQPIGAQFQATDWAVPSGLDLGEGDAAAAVPLSPLMRYSSADFCPNSTVQASVLFPHGPQQARASASAR